MSKYTTWATCCKLQKSLSSLFCKSGCRICFLQLYIFVNLWNNTNFLQALQVAPRLHGFGEMNYNFFHVAANRRMCYWAVCIHCVLIYGLLEEYLISVFECQKNVRPHTSSWSPGLEQLSSTAATSSEIGLTSSPQKGCRFLWDFFKKKQQQKQVMITNARDRLWFTEVSML